MQPFQTIYQALRTSNCHLTLIPSSVRIKTFQDQKLFCQA